MMKTKLFKRTLILTVLLVFFLCLIGCGSDTVSENSGDDQPGDIASDANEVSTESEESVKTTHNVIMTTDKTEYGFNDKVICEMRSEDENEYFTFKNGPDFAFVQYWNSETSEWTACEKEFAAKEIGLEGLINAYTVNFVLSERADEGKEKYRVGMKFDWGTFYSNEFTVTE